MKESLAPPPLQVQWGWPGSWSSIDHLSGSRKQWSHSPTRVVWAELSGLLIFYPLSNRSRWCSNPPSRLVSLLHLRETEQEILVRTYEYFTSCSLKSVGPAGGWSYSPTHGWWGGFCGFHTLAKKASAGPKGKLSTHTPGPCATRE